MARAIEQLKQAMEVCELGALTLPDQVDALMDAGKAILQEMPTLTLPNEWVSVDENLPDFDVPVLVYVKDIFDNKSIINITKYTITYDLTNNWLGYENNSFKITHWMPLPAPPGKKED